MRHVFTKTLFALTLLSAAVSCQKGQEGQEEIKAERLELNKTALSLKADGEELLTVTVIPTEAHPTLLWTSSDTCVATVINGLVRGVAEGTAVVTVSTSDGTCSARCEVTVVEEKYIHVESVTLDKTTYEICPGDSFQLNAIVLPEDADDKRVDWSSSDSTVAVVDSDGKVTAGDKEGETVVTATTKDGGKKASCKVTVSSIRPNEVEAIKYEDWGL